MGLEINNPFSGGLVAANMAASNFGKRDIGGSIQKLAQANALERIAPMVQQTNMYNMDTMLPKLNAEGLRLDPNTMAQLQKGNQSLAYDKINTSNIAKLFMNTGKLSGGGSGTTAKNAGYSKIPNGDVTDHSTFVNNAKGYGVTDSSALLTQNALSQADNNLTAASKYRAPVFSPSVGDLFSNERAQAANQLARLGYFGGSQNSPTQQLTNPTNANVPTNPSYQQQPVQQPTANNQNTQQPSTNNQTVTTQNANTVQQPGTQPQQPNAIDNPYDVNAEVSPNKDIKSIYGNNFPADDGQRKIDALTAPTEEGIAKSMDMLTKRISDINNSSMPQQQKDAAIAQTQTMIDRLKQVPQEYKQKVQDIQSGVQQKQDDLLQLNANTGSFTPMQDTSAQYKVLNDTTDVNNFESTKTASNIEKLKNTSQQELQNSEKAKVLFAKTGNPQFKQMAIASENKANEYMQQAARAERDFNTKKIFNDKEIKRQNNQLVLHSTFDDGKATIRSVVGDDTISALDSNTFGGGLDSIIKDLDNMTIEKNRRDGKTAYEVGNDVFLVGKDSADIKAKFSSLLKAAASPSKKDNIYNTYMNELWRKSNDDQNSDTERENYLRTYKWFADNINDKQGHRKLATDRGLVGGFTRPWKQLRDNYIRE